MAEVNTFIDRNVMTNCMAQYIENLSNYTVPTEEEMNELLKRAKNGDKDAWSELIVRNQRLVIKVAKHYKTSEMKLEDLVSEGNFGLIKAIDKFDPSQNTKLSTYAVFWIRQAIGRAILEKSGDIRVPVYMGACLTRLRKTTSDFEIQYSRKPSVKELSKLSGYKTSEIETAMKYDHTICSLDYTILPSSRLTDVPHTLAEVIEDENVNVERTVVQKQIAEELNRQMDRVLSEKERNIVKMRFGIDQERKTLAEVGEIYGVSREYIRQVEARALKKLGKCKSIKDLA